VAGAKSGGAECVALKSRGRTCIDVEAVANRWQRCVRFGRSLGFEPQTSRMQGTCISGQSIVMLRGKFNIGLNKTIH